MKLLVVDNFDSFTYMLVDYLQQAGAVCRVVRTNESWSQLTDEPVDAVVLSPGPGVPGQAGRLMDVIEYYHQQVPMLGVCLGHQALGEFFGAKLIPAHRPMHGKVSLTRVIEKDVLWQGLPTEFDVTRYHSLVLTDMPDSLACTAVTQQDEVMALRHQTLPIWGIQFHPEAALTQYGLRIIENWIEFVLFRNKKTDSATSLTIEYA
ncbi:aminodeoxychorismate/anthranilate synthase component II [Spirosoma sp. KCTC 42546]|uniref:anthranilate synthase component II n=1 Tax=Spirosoma sp. KCTC 42546 TaxID=2520506 RepID=UPI00115736B2|nr:aminodeoxychorismate/anthranilate synthase component II [Spirosoma sp. KCTC 42546]QDK78772.1 aminodeoxychorismate/anthranilate synthase component II [Spirosoma sp. KCTC 42546]